MRWRSFLLQVFVDSFVRPGCTHLTITALLSESEGRLLRQAGAAALAQRLLQRYGKTGKAGLGNMLVSQP